MTYLRELRLNWPNLLGAALGLGFGVAMNHHMTNLFGPALIADFGWTKSQFALLGALGLVSLFFAPAAGLITDRYGPRVAGAIGFCIVPLGLLALSFMSGSIYQFFGIMLVINTVGILTATMVFTRVVVERFDVARGIALSFLLSFPPLVTAVAAPMIGSIIEAEGWRTGYRVLALMSATGGIAAISLIGSSRNKPAQSPRAPKLSWAEFREMARSPIFLLLLAGMFLCNFPQVLVASQMNILLMENGADMRFATFLVSVYSVCVVAGRFISGYALDRIAPHLVAIMALGLPTVGYCALAMSFDAAWVLGISIALIGLAQGAETDVGAYLTSRRFDLARFSFVFSMLMTAMALASALGALLLSYTLHLTDSFDIFLYVSAAMTLFGAVCFYLTGGERKAADRPPAAHGPLLVAETGSPERI